MRDSKPEYGVCEHAHTCVEQRTTTASIISCWQPCLWDIVSHWPHTGACQVGHKDWLASPRICLTPLSKAGIISAHHHGWPHIYIYCGQHVTLTSHHAVQQERQRPHSIMILLQDTQANIIMERQTCTLLSEGHVPSLGSPCPSPLS